LATSPPAALAPLTVCAVDAAPWMLVEAAMLADISRALSAAAWFICWIELSTAPAMCISWSRKD
jgi:hypothetical protein